MKHSLSSVLLGVLTIHAAACGDDGGGQQATVDAPTHQQGDAPEGVDGPVATGSATLVLVGAGAAASGAKVEWYDASGAVTADGGLDADGKATASVAAGAAVTLAIGTQLFTTLAIQPGDTITITVGAPDPTSVGTVSLRAPVGTAGTTLKGQLGGEGDSATINTLAATNFALDSKGVEGGKFDALALAQDNTGATTGYAADFDLAAPTTAATLAHTMSTFKTDLQSVVLNVANAPAGAAGAVISIAPMHGGRQFDLGSAIKQVDATTHAATATVKLPNAAFSNYIYETLVIGSDQKSVSGKLVAASTVTTPQTFDFNSFMPLVHQLGVAQTTGIQITAIADGSVATAAGALASYTYTTSGGSVTQTVAGPAGATLALSVPALGPALVAYQPSAPFTATAKSLILIGGDALFADANAFRQNWSTLQGLDAPPAGLSGTILISQVQGQ